MLSVRHSLLSRSIAQLEHQVGVTLFERSSAGVKPTAGGRAVLRVARLVLEQVDTLVQTGRHSGRGDIGRISIGFNTSMSAGSLRATLMELKRRFPQIELATLERPRARLADALRSGRVDVVISPGQPLSTNNKVLSLWSERILVLLPMDHRLAGRDPFYWTDLRNETILLSEYDPARELESLLASKLGQPSDGPKTERHDVSRGIIKSLVTMGLGLSLAIESDAGATLGGLLYQEVRDISGISRIGFFAEWRADNGNPALARLLELLSERYPSPPAR
ncbi:DNA-binding transcriptional LysR family regulator [Bradyrhizobium sp. GM22.5]